MSTLFISYRRNDSEGEAGRLADDLSRRFGEGAVFMDVDTIQPGRDFRKAIDESIRSCDVLLAIVGPDWLGAVDGEGKLRLNDESDYVRLEIASALKRDIAVIPVIVRGARMPTAQALPQDLCNFAYRNCVELTHARWKSDVQFLVDALLPILESSPPAAVVPPAADTSMPDAEKMAEGNTGTSDVHEKATSPIDEAFLHTLSLELARYIGPIAPMLVKRAQRRCANVADLIAATAEEIDTGEDRAAYLTFGSKLTRGHQNGI